MCHGYFSMSHTSYARALVLSLCGLLSEKLLVLMFAAKHDIVVAVQCGMNFMIKTRVQCKLTLPELTMIIVLYLVL